MPEQEPDWIVLRRRAIGERIRTVRRHRKLSQEQLANLIEIDRRSVHRYETAQRDPALSMLLRMADALDVPVSLLVSGSLELDLRNAHRDARPTL
ncbi:helix-turn-helix transcriptional regulator [Streptomyces sp. KC 17012]|uniref:helix-turn-helix domain-containing protein n=1 Tax=Streptomyces plumbidurans TaxID=2814589 RepID=UPI001C9DAC8F|nr:helix-turn-helix transcriptional regulator [Streptomyces plumbidurans]MBY8341792.1 helix-turn-helix transcriptional regulator [Streptomyces plumbidurans]